MFPLDILTNNLIIPVVFYLKFVEKNEGKDEDHLSYLKLFLNLK